jgi:tetratricopeptide (TPR) repeat protein
MVDPLDSRVRLTVAMMVRDAEGILVESLNSVQAIADEMLVLDTGSVDRTLAVARLRGAAVIQAAWADDFSAARNLLMAQAAGEWILWLDAGERLDEESAVALRRFVDHEADRNRVYMLMVETPPVVAGASAEQVAQARLVPRRPELQFEGRLRESVLPSAQRAGMHVESIAATIRRHACHNDPIHKAHRAYRNLRLIDQEVVEGGVLSTRLLLAQGEAFADINRPNDAREAFRAAIEAAEHGSSDMLEGYYGLLACSVAGKGGSMDPVALCLEALEIYPLDAQLLLTMGSQLQAVGRLDLAARSFRAAVDHGQVNLEIWHLSEIAEVAAVCLSLTLQLQGKDDEAAELLDQALSRNGLSIRLRRHAIDLHVKHGRMDIAVGLARRLPIEPRRLKPFCDAVRGACRAAVGDWTPALAYLQSAYAAGCEDTFCLRWLVVTLLSNGQTKAAEPILRQWHGQEPQDREARAYLDAILRPATEMAFARAGAEGTRILRLDPAGSVLDVCPTFAPIIAQSSTVDAGPGVAG